MLNPIIDNETLLVNEDESTIQRCSHDEENPYALISRSLIRDSSISPDCRWLIIYFLSMKDGWKINMKQLMAHLKPYMGRDKVYALVNEAIEAGYMKREETKTSKGKNNLCTQTKYFVAEKPKFKKSFRRPDFQDTEIQDTENTDVKERTSSKKEHIEEDNTSLKVPEEPIAAKAAGEEASAPSKQKPKREKSDFSPKVREVANQMINLAIKYNPVYRPPSDLTKFLAAVASMIETDKQDVNLLLKAFEWAVSDNEERDKFKGWQGVVCTNNVRGRTTNPAEIFKKHFSKIHSQMNSRPKRKFAASSDDAAALECMEEMNKRAL